MKRDGAYNYTEDLCFEKTVMLLVIMRSLLIPYMMSLEKTEEKRALIDCLVLQHRLCRELSALTSTICSLSELTLNLKIALHYQMRTKSQENCFLIIRTVCSADGSLLQHT